MINFNTRFILLLIHIIFFNSRAIKLTGPFVTMIFSMITGDMFTFSMIYIIFLFGFSQSFYFLQYNIEKPDLYGDYHSTYVGLFQMTLGEYEVSKEVCKIDVKYFLKGQEFCRSIYFHLVVTIGLHQAVTILILKLYKKNALCLTWNRNFDKRFYSA